MGRYRIFACVAVAETATCDQLILDEVRDAYRHIIDAHRVIVLQYVSLRALDELFIELRCAAALPRLVQLTAEQAQQRGLDVQFSRMQERPSPRIAIVILRDVLSG